MRDLLTRVALLLVLVGIAFGTTGCDQATIDANMAKAKATLAAINRGALVTESAIRQGIDAACADQQGVYTAAMVSRSLLLQQTGPNTTANIDKLDRALVGYNNACAAASNPNASDLASLLSVSISAYASVKAAQAKAGG